MDDAAALVLLVFQGNDAGCNQQNDGDGELKDHEQASQLHSFVAFLPFVRVTRMCLIPKPWEFKPRTMGEHIKRERLKRGLLQKDVAEVCNVDAFTVLNWEKGYSQPMTKHLPKLIKFLGYNPLHPIAGTVAEKLKAKRLGLGLSQKEAATHLQVDESTWTRWERGKRMGNPQQRKRVASFLGILVDELERA